MDKVSAVLAIVLFWGMPAGATPPSSLEVDYVKGDGKLYVYMDHLSRDHTRHYIRKVSVMKNGEEIATKSNRQQVDPNHYSFSIDVQAAAGDELTVITHCSEGGKKSSTFIVPKDDQSKKEVKLSEVKAKVEGGENKREQAPVYGSKEEPFKDKSEVYKSKAGTMERKGGY